MNESKVQIVDVKLPIIFIKGKNMFCWLARPVRSTILVWEYRNKIEIKLK